jgi:hypothetical protein
MKYVEEVFMKLPDWLNPWKHTKVVVKEIAQDLQQRVDVVAVDLQEKVDRLLYKHTNIFIRQINEMLYKIFLAILVMAVLFLVGLFGVLKFAQ